MDPVTAPDSFCVTLPHAAATGSFGARLAHALRPGLFVALVGTLGTGKTTLARGLIAAWTGDAEDAPSPTYTLVQVYDGPKGPLWHADLYRLRGPEDAEELALDEAIVDGVALVEWPERLGPSMPARRLEVALSFWGDGRRACVTWHGEKDDVWAGFCAVAQLPV